MGIIRTVNFDPFNTLNEVIKTITFPPMGALLGYRIGVWNGSTIYNTSLETYKELFSKMFENRGSNLLYGIYEHVENFSISKECSLLQDTWNTHSFEIRITFMWGTLTYLFGKVLEQNATMREHSKTRVLFATLLGAGTIFGVATALDIPIEPENLLDIAIKVGFIGIAWKATNNALQLSLYGVEKACNIGRKGLFFLDCPSSNDNKPTQLEENKINKMFDQNEPKESKEKIS